MSAVEGLQQHAGSFKGAVRSLGNWNKFPAEGLTTWGVSSAPRWYEVPIGC